MTTIEDIAHKFRRAALLYREASFSGHSAHWDKTMQGGTGCLECKRIRELRCKADAAFDEASKELDLRGGESRHEAGD